MVTTFNRVCDTTISHTRYAHLTRQEMLCLFGDHHHGNKYTTKYMKGLVTQLMTVLEVLCTSILYTRQARGGGLACWVSTRGTVAGHLPEGRNSCLPTSMVEWCWMAESYQVRIPSLNVKSAANNSYIPQTEQHEHKRRMLFQLGNVTYLLDVTPSNPLPRPLSPPPIPLHVI